MRAVHWGPAAGVAAEAVLLTVLASTVGLSPVGWAVGLATATVTATLLVRALARRRTGGLGPADWVTLVRATLAGAVAALVADSLTRHTDTHWRTTVVTITAIALVLDAVDGRLARRTGTVSPLGARFDMEVDAYLILVLSTRVAADGIVWVLAIGAARYVFVGASWWCPWLRRAAPPRPWCKVVAALQGIVLVVAVSQVIPGPVTQAALLVALALLAESFAHEAWWLWRHRQPQERRRQLPAWADRALTGSALLLVWAALAAPDDWRSGLSPGSVAWVPVEGLALAALLLVLPGVARSAVAVVAGVAVAVLVLVKALDAGFLQALDRPFDPIADLGYAGSAMGVLTDSLGRVGAVAAVIGAGLVVVGIVAALPLAGLRLARAAARHRVRTSRGLLLLVVAWAVVVAAGGSATPIDAQVAVAHVDSARTSLAERASFAAASARDPYAAVPGDQLLTALRGKDVLIVFVESYGRVALEGLPGSPGLNAALDAGTAQLRRAGYVARSAFLTSPTFGGTSWLAHSTLQSGLWVASQERYNQLVAGRRLTLTSAFHKAGWRTVADVPANRHDWPEGIAFYGYDRVYDSRTVGYRGPGFGYGPIPDQYTLAALQRLELSTPGHQPVVAEVDLVSSHLPWAPLPHLIPWAGVGDGSVFDPQPSQATPASVAWRSRDSIRAAYSQSIVYSMDTLVSFLAQSSDPNLVVVALGDHQPSSVVSGTDPGHDVPISLIARDPSVLRDIAGWGWQDGLRPSPTAPVWRMDAFRDHFLAAYGTAAMPASAVVNTR